MPARAQPRAQPRAHPLYDRMRELDERLAACASLVGGRFVCDVGTDHGKLPAFLLRAGICDRAICADMRKKPLSSARMTMNGYGISDKVLFVLSDGLDDVPLEGVTDIVIAGLGGEQMANIITRDMRTRDPSLHLVLQPMKRPEHLRRELYRAGFDLVEEHGVKAAGHLYSVMSWYYRDTPADPGIKAFTGALDPRRELDAAYLADRVTRLERAALGMREQNPDGAEEILEMTQRIRREIL